MSSKPPIPRCLPRLEQAALGKQIVRMCFAAFIGVSKSQCNLAIYLKLHLTRPVIPRALSHCYKSRILTSHKTVSFTSCSPRSTRKSKHYAYRPLISGATPYLFDLHPRHHLPSSLRTFGSSCSPTYPFLLPGCRQIRPCQLLVHYPIKHCSRPLRNPSQWKMCPEHRSRWQTSVL